MPISAVKNGFCWSQGYEVGLGSRVVRSGQQKDRFLRVGVQVSRGLACVDDDLAVDPEIPGDPSAPGGIREGSDHEQEPEEEDDSKRSKELLHGVFVTTKGTMKPEEVSEEAERGM